MGNSIKKKRVTQEEACKAFAGFLRDFNYDWVRGIYIEPDPDEVREFSIDELYKRFKHGIRRKG